MNKRIIKYLKSNKDKYSREQLIEALRKAGFPKEDIQKGVEAVYYSPKKKTSFWDFKNKKHYAKRREKVLDFIGGLLLLFAWAYIIFGFGIRSLFPLFIFGFGYFDLFILMGISFLVLIIVLIFLFAKRRFMFYGMLIGFLCFVCFKIFDFFFFFPILLF